MRERFASHSGVANILDLMGPDGHEVLYVTYIRLSGKLVKELINSPLLALVNNPEGLSYATAEGWDQTSAASLYPFARYPCGSSDRPLNFEVPSPSTWQTSFQRFSWRGSP